MSIRNSLGIVALLMAALLGGCTTVGVNTKERASVDYGPAVSLNVCVLRAPGVKPERVDELMAAVNKEFAPYAIRILVPWQRPWTRSGFTHTSLFDDVARRDLEPPCDRLVALVDRNAGDFVWGLLLPEVLGEVDETTHTRGYIVATMGSLNQMFEPPDQAAVHEFYHLLGCPHALSLSKCYHLIAALKSHVDPANDFVPGITANGQFLLTRANANALMRLAVASETARREGKNQDQAQPQKIAACVTPAAQATPVSNDSPKYSQSIVCVCIDKGGVLTQDPVIASSSGNPKMDEDAVTLAKESSGRYRPLTAGSKPVPGCFQFPVTFEARDEKE